MGSFPSLKSADEINGVQDWPTVESLEVKYHSAANSHTLQGNVHRTHAGRDAGKWESSL